MPRRFFYCFAAIALMTGCAYFPDHGTVERKPARHYHGVVLDKNTGAPVPRALVTGEYYYLGTTYLLPDEHLGFTLSREDGSFDLTIPASKKPVNHLEAMADVPLADYAHPRRGQTSTFHGSLNHVSTRRTNTILVR